MKIASERKSSEASVEIQLLREMPKVELHVHLEGATDGRTIWELAQRNKVDLPVERMEDLQRFFEYRDFDHFVQAYYAATSTMHTVADWRLMIDRFMAGQAEQNIIYSEVFISASHHLGRHDHDEWIQGIKQALEEGEKNHGVKIMLIPDISRETPETSFPVLDFVTKAWEAGIALGLGLGGPEVGFPPELFVDVFAEARRRGLRVVAHAGETGGPESVRGAWRGLGAERIGHGFRVLDDASLTKEMVEAQVPFEVNPSSNFCIGVVPKDQPHPIRDMVDQGLVVTVNSDDPALFDTTLTKEYIRLYSEGFSVEELWQLSKNALESSFLFPPEKERIRKLYQDFAVNHSLPA